VIDNPVKRTLEQGGIALGTMVTEFATPGIARLAASAGADFVLFDLEHTGYGIERLRWVLAAARAADTVPFLRVPDSTYDLVARGLDVGALGVMVPQVESADEAAQVAAAARYPPVGRRGFGMTFRDDWAPGGVAETLRHVNAQVLTLIQIETAAGLAAVDEIATVDGVDVLWIGHFDLTASLGIPGEFETATYRDALERVLDAGRRHGKPVGMVCSSVDEGRDLLARGFRLLSYGIDVWLYEATVRAGLDGLRS
jgi:2-dehydro-3-deoxyglucarate aldolase/4-hydroxy-2-oxoheptanedioate aldolase